jgi:hypothetical protein
VSGSATQQRFASHVGNTVKIVDIDIGLRRPISCVEKPAMSLTKIDEMDEMDKN